MGAAHACEKTFIDHTCCTSSFLEGLAWVARAAEVLLSLQTVVQAGVPLSLKP